MRRILKRVTALILTAAILASTCVLVASGDEEPVTLSNDFIKVDVNRNNGGFHIDTVKGNKLEKDDDNKMLLHNSTDYDTSFTSVRITRGEEYQDYIFGRSYGFLGMEGTDIKTEKDGSRIISTWTVDNIMVTQTIELANSASDQYGMVNISYTARVLDDRTAKVEFRIMLDTALGYQDYAYYSVPQDEGKYMVIEREMVLEDGSMFKDMMFGTDDKLDPRVTAYTVNGTVGDVACVPTKVAFGHWNNLASTVFDFVPNPDLTFTNEYNVQYLTADSAYALYYDMGKLTGGKVGEISTNYGVYSNAGVVEGEKLAINIAGAKPMTLSEDGKHYKPSDESGEEDTIDRALQQF